MATMGRYCKAYYARQFNEFVEWRPDLRELRPATVERDGQDVQDTRTTLHDEDVLYLQENYVVTDGIALDQHVVFDAVTPAWQQFCHEVLQFRIP